MTETLTQRIARQRAAREQCQSPATDADWQSFRRQPYVVQEKSGQIVTKQSNVR